MTKFFLYTIWQRVPDLVENPAIPDDLYIEYDQNTFTLVERNPETGLDENVEHDIMILDPNNPTGVRYVAIKCTDSLAVAQAVCRSESGEFVYTHTEAFYGENL